MPRHFTRPNGAGEARGWRRAWLDNVRVRPIAAYLWLAWRRCGHVAGFGEWSHALFLAGELPVARGNHRSVQALRRARRTVAKTGGANGCGERRGREG